MSWLGTGDYLGEEKRIDEMIQFLKNEIKKVSAFVICFKHNDNRLTSSLRNLIKVLSSAFGDGFWGNVILEVTHWSFHPYEQRIRKISHITEKSWNNMFNKMLRKDFSVNISIPVLFIDTYYNKSSSIEYESFSTYTNKLWIFAITNKPFICKDVKAALTEVRQLQKTIYDLKLEITESNKTIDELTEDNKKLNFTMAKYEIELPNLDNTPDNITNHNVSKSQYIHILPEELGAYGGAILVLGVVTTLSVISIINRIRAYKTNIDHADLNDDDDFDNCKN